MNQRRALPALALVAASTAALSLSACATLAGGGAAASAQRASLLSSAPLPRDRPCRVAEDPAVLPAPEALVDAPALREAAVRAWRAEGSPAGHVLLSMRYAPDGTNVRRAVLESTLPPALADSLQVLVFAHRRSVASTEGGEWGVRLRMDLGETPALRVGRWQLCAASPRDGRLGQETLAGAWDVRNVSAPEPQSRVWIRVRLDASGAVTDARVERAPVRGMADWRVLHLVRTIPFHPALEDGFPVPGETSISLPVSSFATSYGALR